MSKRRQLPRESGVAYRGLFLGGELLINSSFSVEKAYISYFYCHQCFKASIIVCIDHLFSRVG